MKAFLAPVAVLGLALTVPALATADADRGPTQDGRITKTVTVEMKGKLSQGLTQDDWGWDIHPRRPNLQVRQAWFVVAGGVSYELDFSQDRQFLDAAGKLDGQTVIVTGRLETRYRRDRLGAGGELGGPKYMMMEYPVVVVSGIKADESDFVRKTTTVRLVGQLQYDPTEIYRPYGVYDYITAQGQCYYLHFGQNVRQDAAARGLCGRVIVTGTLEQDGRWLIVHVESVEAYHAK
jgi:hypothetical protein